MKNLELNPEFSLFGQINFDSVKMALDRDEMEEVVGGSAPRISAQVHEQEGGGGGGGVRNFLTGCAGATVGLVAGFVGLATLTAASGGLATGLAVGGWLYASAQWGATCR